MSLECREKTMTCEGARHLTARQVAGEAVGSCDAQHVQHHLETCELCRLHLEELLAARVLQEAESPRPPQDLADSISSAALTYMRYQNRPMHQKALGSPAFFATCASLLCGAIICLLASLRVAAVPGVNAVAAPIARTSQDAAGDSGGTVLPVQPDAVLAACSRATGYVTELLMSLPGGERPASLVAFYPRRPTLVSLRSSGPARLQPAPIGRARGDCVE